MAGLYAVAAWLIVQVSGTVLSMFDAPAWLPRSIVILLMLGLVPALIFAWVFELTPEGLRREGEVPVGQSIMSETGQRMNHMIISHDHRGAVVAAGTGEKDRLAAVACRRRRTGGPIGQAGKTMTIGRSLPARFERAGEHK
jgi:hypothetical protein